MINIRRLAAVDIYLHGKAFVLVEFGGAIVLLGAITIRQLWSAHYQHTLASMTCWYFMALTINYIPLLLYAIAIIRNDSAYKEIESDLINGRRSLWKYSIQQLWLIVPFIIPAAAIFQEIQKQLANRLPPRVTQINSDEDKSR